MVVDGHPRGSLAIESPVVEAVRQDDHGGREAITPDVRDLPGLVWMAGEERLRDRSAALCAGIVSTSKA